MSTWLEDYLRERVTVPVGCMDGTWSSVDAQPEMTVRKYGFVLPVSYDLAMDCGLIPDTRPPRKPPTRRERFRWWRSGLRDRVATWAYERISGEKFPDPYDD